MFSKSEDPFEEEIESIAEIKVVSGCFNVFVLSIFLFKKVVSEFIDRNKTLQASIHVAELVIVTQSTQVLLVFID